MYYHCYQWNNNTTSKLFSQKHPSNNQQYKTLKLPKSENVLSKHYIYKNMCFETIPLVDHLENLILFKTYNMLFQNSYKIVFKGYKLE